MAFNQGYFQDGFNTFFVRYFCHGYHVSFVKYAEKTQILNLSYIFFRIKCQTRVDDSLSKATMKFALDVLKANGNADKNVFFSPASISVCVGMAYAGSAGQTNTQINKAVFNGMNDQLIYDQMKNLSETLNSPSTSYKLNSANRLYVQNKFPILQSYLDKVKTYFQNDVKSVDFVHNAEPTRIEINTWVENVTNSKIKDLLPQGSLDSSTALVLVNAIYFKGDWSRKFNSSNTAKRTFYSSTNKNSQIDMMKQVNEKFYYTEDNDVQVLGLPYVTDQLAFYIFLPKQRFGLSQLESKLTQDYFSNLLESSYERKVAEVCRF